MTIFTNESIINHKFTIHPVYNLYNEIYIFQKVM